MQNSSYQLAETQELVIILCVEIGTNLSCILQNCKRLGWDILKLLY